jgi:hypothetical protein
MRDRGRGNMEICTRYGKIWMDMGVGVLDVIWVGEPQSISIYILSTQRKIVEKKD